MSVTSEERRGAIARLLAASRIGFLATEGERGPESSMAPCALHRGDILLHLSGLARHTKNLARSPRAGFTICTPEEPGAPVLDLPRLSIVGEVAAVAPGEYDAARAAYLRRQPEAEPLFDFPDFRLLRLQPETLHWVGGFGRAARLSASLLREIDSA